MFIIMDVSIFCVLHPWKKEVDVYRNGMQQMFCHWSQYKGLKSIMAERHAN